MVQNGLTAAIVQGYADNGHIDLETARQLELVDADGGLIRYNSLDGIERGRFDEWMNTDGQVNVVTRDALQESSR